MGHLKNLCFQSMFTVGLPLYKAFYQNMNVASNSEYYFMPAISSIIFCLTWLMRIFSLDFFIQQLWMHADLKLPSVLSTITIEWIQAEVFSTWHTMSFFCYSVKLMLLSGEVFNNIDVILIAYISDFIYSVGS